MSIAFRQIVWYNQDSVRAKSNCSHPVYPMESKAQWIAQAIASWTTSRARML
jgi:hypothetical protein